MENLIEENLDININSSLFSPLSMEEKKLLSIIAKGEGIKVDFKRELYLDYESCKNYARRTF